MKLLVVFLSRISALSVDKLEGIRVNRNVVLGEGSYGVVLAAEDSEGRSLVAKRCRDDVLSKRYFAVERGINEIVRASGEDCLYLGTIRSSIEEENDAGVFSFFEKKKMKKVQEYMIFQRVPGRDLAWYISLGACGIEALGAGMEIDVTVNEMCSVDEDFFAFSDPQAAVAVPGQVDVALRVVLDALEAIASLQRLGICHRDVKPANLLVDVFEKRIRLIDFGSAWSEGDGLGYDPNRSPVSPRYCPPEQFVAPHSSNWRNFDSYSIALVGLRILLSPALASDNDLDAFNAEFRKANFRLDNWLGSKLGSTALDLRLDAALAAMHKRRAPASDLWRLLASMLLEDPSQRLDVTSALQRARALTASVLVPASDEEDKEEPDLRSLDAPIILRRAQREPIPKDVRITLQAPAGLVLEEQDDGVVVVGVRQNSPAAALGAPRLGDIVRLIEWKDNAVPISNDVDLATTAAASIQRGALFEMKIHTGKGWQTTHQKKNTSATMCIAGGYRRRGSARAACEDALAIATSSKSIYRLHDPDFPSRERTEEKIIHTLKSRHQIAAVVADGHGGSTASRHCAERLPELIFQQASLSLEEGLRAAWARCVEEYLEVENGVGAVCAAAVIDLDKQRGVALHCGDCRVVGVDGHGLLLFDTNDHRLDDPNELEAFLNRGGELYDGRVRAGKWLVAVPRALGCNTWRANGIVPVADLTSFETTQLDALIIASDGFFDAFSSHDAALFLRARRLFRPQSSANDLAAALATRAANLYSTDDISVAVVLLDHHSS